MYCIIHCMYIHVELFERQNRLESLFGSLQVLPEYEHIYEQYVEELKRIEHDTKDIALNLDQQSLLGKHT